MEQSTRKDRIENVIKFLFKLSDVRKMGTNQAHLGITKASEKLLKRSKKNMSGILTPKPVKSRQRFKGCMFRFPYLDKLLQRKMCKKFLKKTVSFPELGCKTVRTNRAGVVISKVENSGKYAFFLDIASLMGMKAKVGTG